MSWLQPAPAFSPALAFLCRRTDSCAQLWAGCITWISPMRRLQEGKLLVCNTSTKFSVNSVSEHPDLVGGNYSNYFPVWLNPELLVSREDGLVHWKHWAKAGAGNLHFVGWVCPVTSFYTVQPMIKIRACYYWTAEHVNVWSAKGAGKACFILSKESVPHSELKADKPLHTLCHKVRGLSTPFFSAKFSSCSSEALCVT